MSEAARTFFGAGRARVRRRQRGQRFAVSLRRAAFATVLALGAAALIFDFARFADSVSEAAGVQPEAADAIVALTGGAARIEGALDLLAEKRAKRVFISGVHPGVGTSEIAGQVTAERRPFLECCVDLGYEARNTIGNADETRDWAARNSIHSLIVVTSAYHMPRSIAEFSRAMPDVKIIPYPVSNGSRVAGDWWRRADSLRLLAAEYVKYTLARMRMLVEPPQRGAAFAATVPVN